MAEETKETGVQRERGKKLVKQYTLGREKLKKILNNPNSTPEQVDTAIEKLQKSARNVIVTRSRSMTMRKPSLNFNKRLTGEERKKLLESALSREHLIVKNSDMPDNLETEIKAALKHIEYTRKVSKKKWTEIEQLKSETRRLIASLQTL